MPKPTCLLFQEVSNNTLTQSLFDINCSIMKMNINNRTNRMSPETPESASSPRETYGGSEPSRPRALKRRRRVDQGRVAMEVSDHKVALLGGRLQFDEDQQLQHPQQVHQTTTTAINANYAPGEPGLLGGDEENTNNVVKFFEGSHEAVRNEVLTQEELDLLKPWMDPTRPKDELFCKTENIVMLENEIVSTQDRIDGCKDAEETKRREFQVHRQHWEELKKYIDRRRDELVDPKKHVQSLVMNAIPQTDVETRLIAKRRHKVLRRVTHLYRTAHQYEDARSLLFQLRGNREVQVMVKYMEQSILELRERIRIKEELFRNLDNLVEFKKELQKKLKQKCRDVAWSRVRNWGKHPDVLKKRCFGAWDDVVPLLAVEKATIEPQRLYDELWQEVKEKLAEVEQLKIERDGVEAERDEALGKLQDAIDKITNREDEHAAMVAEETRKHNEYLARVDADNEARLNKMNKEKTEEMTTIRDQLERKQVELERLLKELESSQSGNSKDLIRRVVPQNKGVRCMGCAKQMLFRDAVPLKGEHDFPDFELLKDRTLESITEGSPRPKQASLILGQDSPLARASTFLGHNVTVSTGVRRDPRLSKDWAKGEHYVQEQQGGSPNGRALSPSVTSPPMPPRARTPSGATRDDIVYGMNDILTRPRTTGSVQDSDAPSGTTRRLFGALDPSVADDDPMQIRLRKVESFLEAQRRRESDQAAQAKKQLRSRKREPIAAATSSATTGAGQAKSGDFVEQMRGDVKEFKEIYCQRKWK
ncbi:unnamed protein product [Amoebophrya sp. A25]|nr:unnamed protein product [Amoebophrya sp. A25]|eukprot:GSA25T00019783001.1